MQSGPEQLSDWMRRRGFTQADACRYLGVDPSYLSHLMAGRRGPALDNALKLERLTGIPVEAWASSNIDDPLVAETADRENRKH